MVHYVAIKSNGQRPDIAYRPQEITRDRNKKTAGGYPGRSSLEVWGRFSSLELMGQPDRQALNVGARAQRSLGGISARKIGKDGANGETGGDEGQDDRFAHGPYSSNPFWSFSRVPQGVPRSSDCQTRGKRPRPL